jgi:peptidoglycan/xylan/chitin deacetylase (PgdA/CDA1 family)/glycosyltransferase involved in cell wall biosynthesis
VSPDPTVIVPTPEVSIIAMAIGPERLVARALESALSQTAPQCELVVVHDRPDDESARLRLLSLIGEREVRFVAAGAMTPGAARNIGVHHSRGPWFAVVDGGEALPADYLVTAQQALARHPNVSFAVAWGTPPYVGSEDPASVVEPVDPARLAAGPWNYGSTIVAQRSAFDRQGGFDDTLPDLVEWDLLLTFTRAGASGVALPVQLSRHWQDDVRLRELVRPNRYLPAMRSIVKKHRPDFDRFLPSVLVERERTARRLWQHERELVARRDRARAELTRMLDEVSRLRAELAQHGRRTLEFEDLRRLTPISRNWGLDRGLPIDRHYIHAFMTAHALDVRGHTLEMLDSELAHQYGGDRIEQCDVLDIDPGNHRATIVADLRVADQLPSETYDCFILTQTIHLIDDMPRALAAAYRVLKPGGVLLATLPSASMVAVEYGRRGDHWRVTEAGARALCEPVFGASNVETRARGNVLTITAFLYGLSCDDLDPQELDADDPAYPLLVTVRARKPDATPSLRPAHRPAASAVLLFHRVSVPQHDVHSLTVSPGSFRAQLEYLSRHWQVTPLSELVAAATIGKPLDRAVALTFDDGYCDNLEIAAPILAEFGAPATFFLTSEPLDERRRFWWDDLEEMLLVMDLPRELHVRIDGESRTLDTGSYDARRASHDELYLVLKASLPAVREDLLRQLGDAVGATPPRHEPRPMTRDEAQRLEAFPLVDVGGHSVHHVSLPLLTPEDLHREVFECRSALEHVVRRPVSIFAYPFGDVSPEAVRAVQEAGFAYAVGCEPRGVRSREHRYMVPRLPTRNESVQELDRRLSLALDIPPDL